MKKINLNISELKVESFVTAENSYPKGTVNGLATKGHPDCFNTVHVACSKEPHGECHTNPGGCSNQQCSQASCGPIHSCNTNCGPTGDDPACNTGTYPSTFYDWDCTF